MKVHIKLRAHIKYVLLLQFLNSYSWIIEDTGDKFTINRAIFSLIAHFNFLINKIYCKVLLNNKSMKNISYIMINNICNFSLFCICLVLCLPIYWRKVLTVI